MNICTEPSYFKPYLPSLFIRRTRTGTSADPRSCFVHRLVRSVRKGNKVHLQTLGNLGRHFQIEQPQWNPLRCLVVELLRGETALFSGIPDHVEKEAQRLGTFSEPLGKEANGRQAGLAHGEHQCGSGFVRRSAVFTGNVQQDRTLQTMMMRLKAPQGTRVVMDRDVAGEKQMRATATGTWS